MRTIYDNLVDTGTLTATPPLVSTLPITNLQTPERELVARTTSLASQTIDLTLPAVKAIASTVLYRGNFSASATWRVRIFQAATLGVSRTNTLLYFDSFANAAWTKLNTTIDSDPIAGPYGIATADRITATAAAAAPVSQAVVLAVSTQYAASIYVKQGTAPSCEFGLWDNTAAAWIGLGRLVFAGAVATLSGGAATVSVQDVGNGWFRLTLVATTHVTNTSYGVFLYPRVASGSNVGDTLYAWGAQLEVANYTDSSGAKVATSFIPTAGTAVTVAGEPSKLLYDSGIGNLSAPKTLGELNFGIEPLGLTLFTGWGHTFTELWFPTVYGAFVRVTLDDAANPDGYMQAARWCVGTYLETLYVERGVALQWNDSSKPMRMDGGGIHVEPGVSWRSLGVSLSRVPEAERIKLAEMFRSRGSRYDVYVTMFPGLGTAMARDHQFQGYIVEIGPTVLPQLGYANQAIKFEEA